METVKYYHDLGLAFVKGDGILSIGKVETFLLNSDWHLDPISQWKDHKVKEFAWRDNTGVAPSYKGLIELEFADGEIINTDPHSWCWALLGSRGAISKWRPVVVQDEDERNINGITECKGDNNKSEVLKELVVSGLLNKLQMNDDYYTRRIIGKLYDEGLLKLC